MTFLEEADFENSATIPEFYKGKTVLITGGTGFMGNVLIEKLLYSCSDLDRIYLLLRTKKGTKAEDRIADLYKLRSFDRLRSEKPGIFESKVFVVAGDMMEVGLGLSQEDRTLLVNKVNIIFHVAASVRFEDPLKFATTLNLRGSREIVELAKDVRNLQSLVHVSTSYSNTNQNPIEEKMYPPHADWRETIKVCETVDEHMIRVLTPKYLGKIPNTYTFTKQLAEHVMYEQKGKLPIVIVRPSIVISSVSEPMPGWIANFNGPVGLLVACGKGIMRSIYSDPNLVSDYIPVDVAIRSLIVASWSRGLRPLKPSDDVPIYNCCASKLNVMTLGEIVDVGKQLAGAMPLSNVLWSCGGSITTSKTYHYIRVLLQHLLPAIFVDTILYIIGQKPILVKLQRRIYIANSALGYYITRQWVFSNDHFLKLRSCVKKEDKQSFYYEIENIDKYEYFANCIVGGRTFLLNETPDNIPKARVHYKRMYALDKIVMCLFYSYIFWWFINLNFVQNTLNSTWEFLVS